MTPYQQRIANLLRTIDTPLIDMHEMTLPGFGGRIDYGRLTEYAANPAISTSERAKLRVALMLNAERSLAGWDFLAELKHLDLDARELALRALDTAVGTGAARPTTGLL